MRIAFALLIPIVVCLWAEASVGEQKGAEFFVSAKGKDSNPGTKAKPFASLEAARDAVRALKRQKGLPTGGITVWVRGGTYYFDKTLELTADDSGTSESRVVYRSFPGETVRLSGGRPVRGFTPVTDPAVLERLEESDRGKVVQADLKAQGITDLGELARCGFGLRPTPRPEVFFNGKPMTLARWPNDQYALISTVPNGQHGGKFGYDDDRPKRWRDTDDIWVHGYWTYPWAESYEKVKSIDTDTRVIETEPPHGVYGYTKGGRFYAVNILEELDQPGEWYLDRKTGTLYFWPPGKISRDSVYLSMLSSPIIALQDASHITVRGFDIEHVRDSAVSITGGTDNLIAGCRLRNIGNAAIIVKGGQRNGVLSCDISQTGGCGIIMDGGDRQTLTPAGNFVENCDIHDFSRWVYTYQPAILLNGVGNRVSHNHLHYAPHSAIILGGNDHVFEFNDVHHVCMETGDAGAYYVGRDWTQRGNVVRYNHFHDLHKTEGLIGYSEVMAVYLDDFTCGTRIYGNIFQKAGRAAFIGGGRDNTVENNVFVDCNPAVHVDARGLGWAKNYFSGEVTTLFDRLKSVNGTQPPYSTRYPQLATILDDEPAVPKGNVIARNIFHGGRWMDILDADKFDKSVLDIRDNLLEGDPCFVDAESGDFRLRDDSPAWKLGFKRIPSEHIGIYQDEYRER